MYAGRTGKEALAKSVKRLQDFGYLVITRERSRGGRLGAVVWTVYDSPQPGNPECGMPQTAKGSVDSPQPGKPDSGFPPYTKERINKNKKAAPALMSGEQPRACYLDEESGEWRRR